MRNVARSRGRKKEKDECPLFAPGSEVHAFVGVGDIARLIQSGFFQNFNTALIPEQTATHEVGHIVFDKQDPDPEPPCPTPPAEKSVMLYNCWKTANGSTRWFSLSELKSLREGGPHPLP